jgi:hypothetical protein
MIVKIGAIPYTVATVTDMREVCHNRSGADLYGQISYAQRSIRILHNGCAEEARQAFLHELLHGITEQFKIRELMDGSEHLETPIDQLATGLLIALESLGVEIPIPAPGPGPAS